MKKSSLLFILLLPFVIFQATFAQEAKTKDVKKETETKPLKMEEGTVTVDPQIVSANYKASIFKHLKKLKSSFYNSGQEDKYTQIMKSYSDATISYQTKDYPNSRRKFEQNNKELNDEAKNFSDKYKEMYTKLYSDTSFVVVEMKVKATGEDNFIANLEKLLASANEFFATSQGYYAKSDFVDSIYSIKSAIHQLIKIHYLINKQANKNVKLSDRIAKNIFIDDDFVPKEKLKDYDDSMHLIHAVREKEREKEREQIKKSIASRFGELKPSEENPPGKEPSKDEKKDKPSEQKK